MIRPGIGELPSRSSQAQNRLATALRRAKERAYIGIVAAGLFIKVQARGEKALILRGAFTLR